MAKLKAIQFKATSLTGEAVEFNAEASVTNEGQFSVEIPDYLEELGRKLVRDERAVHIERPRVHLRVSGKLLEDCERFVKTLLTEYVRCEVATETVILYNYLTDAHYVKDDANGELFPSGVGVESYGKTAKWADLRNPAMSHNSSPFFTVGINARVVQKHTYTRASNVSVKYSGGSEFANAGDGDWAKKLNSYCKLSRPYNGKGEIDRSFMEMPYTEEAAKFFYGLMMSMCKLSDRIHSFVGDKEQLMLAIKTPELLMLEKS